MLPLWSFSMRFDNRQDVELVTLDSRRPARVLNRQRLTRPSNEPEADPCSVGSSSGTTSRSWR
jgi:hypothetical protein